MKQGITGIIKKWPGLYHLAARLYYSLKPVHIYEKFTGTKAREKQWAKRDIAEGYWDTRDHPNKRFLKERLAAFSPFESMMEVGCASGRNTCCQ